MQHDPRETGRSAQGGSPTTLTVSIVTYHSPAALLQQTLASLAAATNFARRTSFAGLDVRVSMIDNAGDLPDDVCAPLQPAAIPYEIIRGQGNVGYGCGHNLAIRGSGADYHLVLNPDIDMAPGALAEALGFMERTPDVGLLSPQAVDDGGALQFLCRRYPALIDLFVRGFMPESVRRYFDKRLASYEMRDAINDRDVVFDPPIVSGCFMLFRTELLHRLSGFDPRYFLYFEDYDLSLRTHKLARVAYVPAVRVLHHGGGAARKGWVHIKMFVASAFRFYNRFGWKLL
jgi:GT2 family glycosyltransferase